MGACVIVFLLLAETGVCEWLGDSSVKVRLDLADADASLRSLRAEAEGKQPAQPWFSRERRAEALGAAIDMGLDAALVEHVRQAAVLDWRGREGAVRVISFRDRPWVRHVGGYPARAAGWRMNEEDALGPHEAGIRTEIREGGWIMPWASLADRAEWLGRARRSNLPDRAAIIQHVRAAPYFAG